MMITESSAGAVLVRATLREVSIAPLLELTIGPARIAIDTAARRICGHSAPHWDKLDLTVIVDRGAVEIFAPEIAFSLTTSTEVTPTVGTVALRATKPSDVDEIEVAESEPSAIHTARL